MFGHTLYLHDMHGVQNTLQLYGTLYPTFKVIEYTCAPPGTYVVNYCIDQNILSNCPVLKRDGFDFLVQTLKLTVVPYTFSLLCYSAFWGTISPLVQRYLLSNLLKCPTF